MAMDKQFSNNAKSTLVYAISDADSIIDFPSGEMLKFSPLQFSYQYQILTIKEGDKIEIVKMFGNGNGGPAGVFAELGANQAVIERAQEGSTAQSFGAGAEVYAAVTADWLQSINDFVFGVTGV